MDPIYLKIQPDTFRLKQKQLFLVKDCQYCGSDHLNYRKLSPYSINRAYGDDQPSWVIRCDDCKSTVGIVVRNKELS